MATGRDRQEYPELPTNLIEKSAAELEQITELNEIIVRACHTDLRQCYASAAELHADRALLADDGQHLVSASFAAPGARGLGEDGKSEVQVWELPKFWPGTSHGGGANMLFCDGHVASGEQASWIAATDSARRRWNNDHEPHPETWERP